jgi:hypothetical protein
VVSCINQPMGEDDIWHLLMHFTYRELTRLGNDVSAAPTSVQRVTNARCVQIQCTQRTTYMTASSERSQVSIQRTATLTLLSTCPRMLPQNASHRPHVGLTYSGGCRFMRDDLCVPLIVQQCTIVFLRPAGTRVVIPASRQLTALWLAEERSVPRV